MSSSARILVAVALVSAVLAFDRSVVVSLAAIAMFILYGMRLVQLEIVHPAVWLPPFIYVYHFNAVILHTLGYEHLEQPLTIVWIGWLSIATAVVVFVVFCRGNEISPASSARVPVSPLLIRAGYLATFGLMLYVCAKFFGSGYTDKSQFHIAQSMPELSYAPLWFSLFYALWFVDRTGSSGRIPWGLLLATGGFTLFCTLALGERDIFLCFCAVSLFLIYHFRRPGKVVLIGLGVLVAGPLLTVLHFLRNVFSRGVSDMSAFADQGMLLSFLYGEFIAGGRNLDIILSNRQWWRFFHGETPLWVLEHKLFPGILVETRNSSMWFHQNFLPDWVTMVGGYGFTFSGDGYINFGMLGVVLWYAVLAAVIVWLYNMYRRGGIFLAVYVVSAPLFVWTMRATMLYLPGAALLILKPLVVIWLADVVLRALRNPPLPGGSPAVYTEGAQ